MTNAFKYAGVLALVLAIFALGGANFASVSRAFGASYQGTVVPNLQWFTGGIRTGDQNASTASEEIWNTCNPTFDGTSLGATSTGQFICSAPGVKAGDLIIGDLPVGAGKNANGAGSPVGGFVLTNAYSTTSGQVAFTVLNLTGAATTSFAQASTSLEYREVR